jgi:ParB-like chromosome segregation protein Spo0J
LSIAEPDFRMIPIKKLHVGNPRINKAVLAGVVKNISLAGLKEPVTVNRRQCLDGGEGYELLNGHCRLEACIELGMEGIPALVVSSKEGLLLIPHMEALTPRPGIVASPHRRVRSRGRRSQS